MRPGALELHADPSFFSANFIQRLFHTFHQLESAELMKLSFSPGDLHVNITGKSCNICLLPALDRNYTVIYGVTVNRNVT